MTDLVNSNVINSFLNEKQFNKEFKAMLNELIDAELEKDINEMDCDLIEDLTDMLIELEQSEDDGFPVIIPLTNAKKIISACSVHNFKSLSRGMKVSLIACIILLSGITCNAAVYQITGNNIAQNIVDSINQKLTDWGIITYADSSDTVVDEVPTGSENLDAGFDNDEETTTKPTENPTEKPTAKPVTTKPEVTGSENLDAGFDDDDEEPTKPEVKPAVKQYKITFDANGGICNTKEKTISYKSSIGDLPTPIRAGYVFGGWYNIDISYKFNNYSGIVPFKEALPIKADTIYNIARDATLTAKWYELSTVTFDPGLGTCDIKTMQVNSEGKITNIPVPVRKGYIFDYWYYTKKDGSTFKTVILTTDLLITENMTFKPHWTTAQTDFTITFDANGGECDTQTKPVVLGEPCGELPVPTRSGYTFIGWYDDRHYGNKLSADTVVTEDMNIYAHWKMSGMITTDIRIKGLKSVYNLGEEINLDDATFQLKVGTIFGIGAEPVDITELLYNDTIPFEEHLTGVDTSTVGEHKITVIFAMDETTISGCGTLTMTGSFTYNVVDCEHKNTTIKKYRAPRCDYEGYTGDTYCKDCDYFLESGESIPKTPHSDTTVILYDKKPTCTEEGYTGNISCSYCHQCLKKGETIPALGHGEAKLYNVKEVSCGHNGYTGDLCCSVCLEVLEKGEVIPKYPHSGKTELVGVKEVTCGHDGYTGDVVCADCGEIFEKGEVLPKYPHPSERVYYPYQEPTCGSSGNAWVACAECGHVFGTTTLPPLPHGKEVLVTVDPTCTQNGYTYYVCEVCGHFIREGEEIPKLGHRNTELRNAKAVTCTEDGYTGDTYCNDCGKTIQKGSVINKLGHKYVYVNEKAELDKDGFRGKQCEHCNDRQPGTVYNAIASIELDEPVLYYSGKPIAPDVKVLDTAGKVITSYNIELPDGRQEVGTYTIKLTFTGNYQGTHYLTYEIKERTSGITNIEKVPTGIVVNWMAAGSADGYEIKLVNAANEKTIRTVDISDGSTSAKININKNLDVYVVIRSYKKTTVNSEETVVYSDWSDKFYVNR